MADNPKIEDFDDEASELRSKLAKRLAFAGVLVALLLGTLTFFDYLASPSDDNDPPVFSEPVPVAPRKEVSQPVKETDSLPEPPTPVVAEPQTAAPPAEPPAPVVAAQPASEPSRPEKTEPVDEANRPTPAAGRSPSRPANPSPSVAAAPVSRPARPVVEAATYPPVERSQPAVAAPAVNSPPSARLTEVRRTTPQVVPPSSLARLFSGFSLQAGVFSSTQRAEELHAKLTLSGLPSSLETRVQVGPFRSRQEAEAAQEKLRELGVETVLLAPKGSKP